MKKVLTFFLVAIATFALTACAPTQEMRKGASFEGLKTYYLMPVNGGEVVFNQIGPRAKYDKILSDAIRELMSSRGFQEVPGVEGAQFALRPLYTEWGAEMHQSSDVDLHLSSSMPIGTSTNKYYLNLEIEVYLPTIHNWAWRGLSYTKLTRENMNAATIREQAKWALQHFPPEAHPSNTQKKQAEAAKKSEENK